MYRLILLLFLISVSLNSCLKNDFGSDGPKLLSVKFSDNSIDISKFDSAVFILNTFDTTVFASKKLVKTGIEFELDISELPVGYYYPGEIALYAQPDSEGVKYQYYSSLNFDPQTVAAITLPAPAKSGPSAWNKRIILEDDENKVAVMIPLSIVDPYFEIKAVNPFWTSITVERDLFYVLDNVNTHTGSAKFECNGNCFINGSSRLINRTAFKDFAVSNSSAIWNKAVAKITIRNNNPDEDIVIEHVWHK